MTTKEMKKDILRSAKLARKKVREIYPVGTKIIDINYGMPYVCIICPYSSEYFFQGEDAGNLLAEAVTISNKFNVSVEDVIIWQSQSW